MSKRLLLSHLITTFFHFLLLFSSPSFFFLSLLFPFFLLPFSPLKSLQTGGKIFKLFITCNFLSFNFVSCRCSLIFLSSPLSHSQSDIRHLLPLPNQPQVLHSVSPLFRAIKLSCLLVTRQQERERTAGTRESCFNIFRE